MPEPVENSITEQDDDTLLGDPELIVSRMEELDEIPGMRQLVGQQLSNSEVEVLEMCARGFASLQADTHLNRIRL